MGFVGTLVEEEVGLVEEGAHSVVALHEMQTIDVVEMGVRLQGIAHGELLLLQVGTDGSPLLLVVGSAVNESCLMPDAQHVAVLSDGVGDESLCHVACYLVLMVV